VPVIIIVLGLTSTSGRRWLDLLALGALAAVCLVSDSRSMTSFLLLSGVIVLWQSFMPPGRRRPRPAQTLLLLGLLSVAAFSLLQALILDGALGDAAQQRTQAQIDTSGSLIAGGRPELGAATALISHRPQGFGSGVLPTSQDVWIAKSGMSGLNYDPNNGYVEGYMFGGQYEVHSVLGDMWLRFGPLGAAFALMLVVCAVYAVARSVSIKAASGLAVLLTLLGAWDTFFSPLLTSSRTLALLFALTAIPVADLARRRRGGAESLSLDTGSPRSTR
jgi:O-antigen ligase